MAITEGNGVYDASTFDEMLFDDPGEAAAPSALPHGIRLRSKLEGMIKYGSAEARTTLEGLRSI